MSADKVETRRIVQDMRTTPTTPRIPTVPSNHYHIKSRWVVVATRDEVAAIFRDSDSLVDWWPAAFLHVHQLAEGDEHELGKKVWLHTKGWLPYTLQLTFEVSGCSYPESFKLSVEGDFIGRCLCRTTLLEEGLEIEFDWKVRVMKPVVRHLSWIFHPVFTANHIWVMRQGRRSLDLELARRRGIAPSSDASIPGPTFPYDRRTRRVLKRLRA